MVARVRVDTSEIDRLRRQLGEQAKPAIQNALQRAVIKTGYKAKDAAVAEMHQVFHSPTRFTLNALRVAIDKQTITATVQPKDTWSRADNYLNVQIKGGARKQKAFEEALTGRGILPSGWLAVPGQGARLDAHGNMSVGQIKQILSWFGGAEPYVGSTQNMTEAGRKKLRRGTRTRAGFEYFAVIPGRLRRNGARQPLKPGIYQRTFMALGKPIKPVLIFVKSATYKPIYPLQEIGEKAAADHFQNEFNTEFAKRWPPR